MSTVQTDETKSANPSEKIPVALASEILEFGVVAVELVHTYSK